MHAGIPPRLTTVKCIALGRSFPTTRAIVPIPGKETGDARDGARDGLINDELRGAGTLVMAESLTPS